MLRQSAILLRGILISQLFSKTLNISHLSRRRQRTVLLGSTDIEGLVTATIDAHNTLAAFAEVIVGGYILVNYLGQAAFVYFVPFVCELHGTGAS